MFEAYPATTEEESVLESDAGDSVTMVAASTVLMLFPDSCAATAGLFELKSSSKCQLHEYLLLIYQDCIL